MFSELDFKIYFNLEGGKVLILSVEMQSGLLGSISNSGNVRFFFSVCFNRYTVEWSEVKTSKLREEQEYFDLYVFILAKPHLFSSFTATKRRHVHFYIL